MPIQFHEGKILFDATGKILFAADAESCCWLEAYACEDDTATGLWAKQSDIPDATPVLKMGGDCFYFPGPATPCPGAGRVDDGTWHADCEACEGEPDCPCPPNELTAVTVDLTGFVAAQVQAVCTFPIGGADDAAAVLPGAGCAYNTTVAHRIHGRHVDSFSIFSDEDPAICTSNLRIGGAFCNAPAAMWTGTKTLLTGPLGVYTRTGGTCADPATINVT